MTDSQSYVPEGSLEIVSEKWGSDSAGDSYPVAISRIRGDRRFEPES